jgi:hypothetical protein
MNPSWLLGAAGPSHAFSPPWLCVAPTLLFPECSTTESQHEKSPHGPNSLKACMVTFVKWD